MSDYRERTPQELEAEIERTRHEMDGTLSAIERRLSRGELIDRGLEYLRHNGATEFASNLGTSVKENPLPIALVSVGLAWLMLSSRKSEHHGALPDRYGFNEPHVADRESAYSETAKERLSEFAGTSRDKAAEVTTTAHEKVSELAGTARQKASEAGHVLAEAAHRLEDAGRATWDRLAHAGDRVTGIAKKAGHGAQRARGQYRSLLEEQPLALGLIGLGIGATLAAVLPRTREENELMGETRERLAQRAREAGEAHLEKAKNVLAEAQHAAGAELESQRIASDDAQSAPATERHEQRSQTGAMGPSRNASTEPARSESVATSSTGSSEIDTTPRTEPSPGSNNATTAAVPKASKPATASAGQWAGSQPEENRPQGASR